MRVLALLSMVAWSGCYLSHTRDEHASDAGDRLDAGDMNTDVPEDATPDALVDAPPDSPFDAPGDAPRDAPGDAPQDAPGDAPRDAPRDPPASRRVTIAVAADDRADLELRRGGGRTEAAYGVEGWPTTTTRTFDLSAGEYELELRVADVGGVISGVIFEVSIEEADGRSRVLIDSRDHASYSCVGVETGSRGRVESCIRDPWGGRPSDLRGRGVPWVGCAPSRDERACDDLRPYRYTVPFRVD